MCPFLIRGQHVARFGALLFSVYRSELLERGCMHTNHNTFQSIRVTVALANLVLHNLGLSLSFLPALK